MRKDTIYKYPLMEIGQVFVSPTTVRLDLPEDYALLDIQMQGNVLTLWCRVEVVKSDPLDDYDEDSENNMEEAIFHIIGTGRDIPYSCEHVATTQYEDFVFHVFQEC